MGALKRTLEPELMDDAAQALAYAKADFSTEDAAFIERLQNTFTIGGQVVDLGCGPGNIALRVAEVAPQATVIGVDGAEAMLKFARERGRPFGDRVRFIRALLPTDGLPQADMIVSNSLLHHLHDPQGLWRTIKQIGRPGTPVFIGDLCRPESAAAAQAIVDTYAADDPEILQRDFLASLHAAFTVRQVQHQLQQADLTLTVKATDDRHLFIWGVL